MAKRTAARRSGSLPGSSGARRKPSLKPRNPRGNLEAGREAVDRDAAPGSIWTATARLRVASPLRADLRRDVCVIGAGIAGMTAACVLARQGRSVVVLEDGPIAGGETSRTTAQLSSVLDRRYSWLEKVHGPGAAGLVAESHRTAIDWIEETVRREGIPCSFERVDGYLFNAPGGDAEDLSVEAEAARRAGISEAELSMGTPMPGLGAGPSLRFPRQAQFHPLRYIDGLGRYARLRKVVIHGQTHVEGVEAGSPVRMTTAGGPTVTADFAIVATNSPIHTMVALHTKQAAYRSYVVSGRVPEGSVPRALYWDTESPYHYVRLLSEAGEDTLIVGGGDHKTGQEDDPAAKWEALADWARRRFAAFTEVEGRWSGQVMESVDGLAYIGPTPGNPNVFVVTGDSGSGMTHGTIAGLLIGDLIEGRKNPWADVYDPSRVSLRAAGAFVRQNLNVAAQYGGLLAAGEVESPREIPAGSGAVLRRGLHQIAVSRDASGKLHERSAVCPHLGCIVAWNDAEKSWDCPCHGSRFTPEGEVLNGPANVALGPVPR